MIRLLEKLDALFEAVATSQLTFKNPDRVDFKELVGYAEESMTYSPSPRLRPSDIVGRGVVKAKTGDLFAWPVDRLHYMMGHVFGGDPYDINENIPVGITAAGKIILLLGQGDENDTEVKKAIMQAHDSLVKLAPIVNKKGYPTINPSSLMEDWKKALAGAGLATAMLFNPLAGQAQAADAYSKPAIVQTTSSYANDEIQHVKSQLSSSKFDVGALTYGILKKESSFGNNTTPRYEQGYRNRYGKAYRHGGTYDGFEAQFMQKVKADDYEQAMRKFYSSYGQYQIMMPVAWELGFKLTPQQLADRDTNRQVYVKYMKRRVLPKATTVQKVGDIYNGGAVASYGSDLAKLYSSYLSKVQRG